MIGLITVTTALGALRLVRGILTHAPFTSASQLLTIGAVAWLTNVIAFSLWFWDLDAGGAAARAPGSPRIPPASGSRLPVAVRAEPGTTGSPAQMVSKSKGLPHP